MKKQYFLLPFLLCMVVSMYGQTTVTLQPNGTVGKDAFISSNIPNDSQGNATEFDAGAWTINGVPLTIRSLIDFDLSSLPAGATLQSAVLTLYNNPNALNGNANGEHVHTSGSNEAVLQRITSPWTEEVSWSNQPTTTSQNEVTLAQDSDPNQNYVLDVTLLVQDIMANANTSFGFLLQLKTEAPYRLLAFASSDHPNAALHPKLEITYTVVCTMLTLQPDATAGKDAFISSNIPNDAQGNTTEFDAGAWTINGAPVTIRSLIDFDLSSLPAGATIQSAELTLHNNPNALNGFANGQHAHTSGSNASFLQRVTSPWAESVTWNTQPSTTTLNQVLLPENTDPFQDYTVDVKQLIQDMLSNPAEGFGLMLKLEMEDPYRILVFASSDHPNPLLHPTLEICYANALATNQPVQKNTVAVFPNPTTGSINIDLKNQNRDTATKYSFVLFDTTGKKVFEDHFMSKSSLSYDISHMQKGMYYWALTSDQSSTNGKLILTN